MSLISVVVPVFHNAESLPELKDRLAAAAETAQGEFEFVFVNDGSGDDSLVVLEGLANRDDRVKVISLSRNFGSNAAMLAGLTYARGECAVIISADLQDPPELIPKMVSLWREGKEVVLAARRGRDDPLMSILLARAFNWLFRRLVFADFPPQGFDFMLIDRKVVDVLVGLKEINSYIFGQTMWVGFERAVIHYDRAARPHGRSRWTTAKKVKYFIDAFAAFSSFPLRIASMLGILMALAGLIYAGVIIILKVTNNIPVTGWASLTIVVLLASGTQLILLGVMGEYLWRTLDAARGRPPFIVSRTLNLHPKPRPSEPDGD